MDAQPAIPDYLQLAASTGTFVSIDVVGSTALKAGENEQDIIYSFLSYHKLISETTAACHGEVLTISGDGMMCRFSQADDAALAVKTILSQLPNFNKRQNRMTRPISLRLGVHTGNVLHNESMASGQIISHTLDLAAKLQQTASPDHARFSEDSAKALKQTPLALVKIGWISDLHLNVYEFGGGLAAAAAKRTLPNPARVLLVEDDPGQIITLKKTLWLKRHDAFPVYSPDQASVCLASWKPHVVVASADLPWDGGWELLKTLRANAQASGIPVIMMSRQATGGIIEKCFRMGANGFLSKPLDEQQLIKRVEMVIREFYS